MPIVTIQRRMMELGRVRLGQKGSRGEPKRLDSFRFTSPSEALLQAVAVRWGGEVRPWKNAPEEGYFEIVTQATLLDIILPPVFSNADGEPTVPYSQWYELWSSGGCQRRCDGVTEALSGKPCLCQAALDADSNLTERACSPTTRVSFMLPDIPGLGVWRLDSHGWNAAIELPGTLEVLGNAAREGKFIPATLRIDHRTRKVPGEGTRRFIVPVIDLKGVTVRQLASGDVPLAINAPQPDPPKPELPAGTPAPEPEQFEHDLRPGYGTPPDLPGEGEIEPLSYDALKQRCTEIFISPQALAGAGRTMFPGRTVKTLSDDERGQLWLRLAAEREQEKARA